MKFVFVSNYLTHHQKPFCDAMFSMLRGNFVFVSTIPIEQERLKMGWKGESEVYELQSYTNEKSFKKACELIQEAEVVILGGAQGIEKFIQLRMKVNKLTFRYSERLYKRGRWRALNPKNWIRNWNENLRYTNKQLYMLCASAYTASDFALLGAYRNKTFKWGYFPKVERYDVTELMKKKLSVTSAGWKHPQASILWAGRLIGWKHPDASIQLAEKLKEKGYSFKMSIIGNGEMETQLRDMIHNKNLEDCVEMLGAMSPDEVRAHMEKADVFLFTSDFNEGWGAVLNESMNSGCAVVASHAIGSVPFLIEDGVNGLIYKNGDSESLRVRVEKLLKNQNYCQSVGRNAYITMKEKWNANVAAERLIKLSEGLQENKIMVYKDGPCSRACNLKNNWYRG